MKIVTVAVAPEIGRKAGDALPQHEISAPAARKIPRRLLVVDDEPLIRWSVAETLVGLGVDVERAGDAATALRLITNNHRAFDVVLLDLRLPDMHDLSLLGTIRQLQPDSSIVLMTAFGSDEVIERAIALGASSVLLKPFELGKMIDAVCAVDDPRAPAQPGI